MSAKPSKKEKKAKESIVEDDDALKVRFSTLNINGEKYKTILTEKFKNRKKWVAPDVKKFYSEIPGTVLKLHVTEGQEVHEGEVMMILEAMKMKNKILFPFDGVVKKIYVSENERVPKGHFMLELE